MFYVETKGCIDVWRALHCARDVPAWMQEMGVTKNPVTRRIRVGDLNR